MSRRALQLLTAMAVVLIITSGTAMAATENGPIYFGANGIYSIDSTVSTQTTLVTNDGNMFDISQDRTTIVYLRSGFSSSLDPGPMYTAPLSNPSSKSRVFITNESASSKGMTMPRFSPDGKTIYFLGEHVVDPPEGADTRLYDVRTIYSVPTGGGEATVIPIYNSDGTPRLIGTFGLSHDGSKFAISGAGVSTVPVSGGVPTMVNRDPCGGAQYPSFSPDDQMIVYARYVWKDYSCTATGTTPIQTLFTTPSVTMAHSLEHPYSPRTLQIPPHTAPSTFLPIHRTVSTSPSLIGERMVLPFSLLFLLRVVLLPTLTIAPPVIHSGSRSYRKRP
jgi:hypothetical protein